MAFPTCIDKLDERGMTLYEYSSIKRDFEALAEFVNSFLLVFSTSVRQDYEGYAMALEVLQGSGGSRERLSAPQKDAIYASRESGMSPAAATAGLTRTRTQSLQAWYEVVMRFSVSGVGFG